MEGLLQLGVFLVLLVVGYSAGRYAERKHYSSIISREKELVRLPAVTLKALAGETRPVEEIRLVSGSVVVSIDYFKRFLSALQFLFGGNVTAYETLLDRGRREAVLRMKSEMPDADIIVGSRIETSTIGSSANAKNSLGSIEVLAYGTAIKYAR